MLLAQRIGNLCQGVRSSSAGRDTGISKPLVGRQGLEERAYAVEEVGHLLCRLVIGVAVRVKGADAGAVLAPFMLPEALVVALVVFPVRLHVAQRIRIAGCLEDLCDVVTDEFMNSRDEFNQANGIERT